MYSRRYVVVLVVGAGCLELAALALPAVVGAGAHLPVVIDLVELASQLALPARCCSKCQGDGRVVCAPSSRCRSLGFDTS